MIAYEFHFADEKTYQFKNLSEFLQNYLLMVVVEMSKYKQAHK